MTGAPRASTPDATDRLELPPPFRFLKTIGSGAHKHVVLAEDPRSQTEVAIARAAGDGQAARAEARILAEAGAHPHLLSIDEAIEHGGAHFLVMPYMSGGDLGDRLEAFPPGEEEALRVAEQIASGLAHLHGHGIVHGDLKPTNILFDEHANVRLCDFGFAREIATAGPLGDLRGTPWYVPPEALALENSGSAGDLYSFGCVLHELLLGRPPFDAPTPEEVLRLQATAQPDLEPLRAAGLPPSLIDLVGRLLAKRPEARPRDIDDVRVALSATRSGLTFSAKEALEPNSIVGDARRALARARTLLDEHTDSKALRIEADTGFGKSAVLASLSAEATQLGATVLRSKVSENSRQRPCTAWLPILEPWAAHFDALGHEDASALRSVIGYSRHPEKLAELDLDQTHLGAALIRFAQTLSKEAPLFLIFDDLQWADAASLGLLERLARSGPPGLRIVASHRPPEASSPLEQWLESDGSRDAFAVEALAPLDDQAAFDLLADLGAPNPSIQLKDLLRETSGGNPELFRRLFRQLSDRGLLEERQGALVCEARRSDLDLPSDLGQAIARDLSSLSVEQQSLLRVAAHIGLQFERGLVAKLIDIEEAVLFRRLDAAIAANIIEPFGSASVTISFANPLARSIAYDQDVGRPSAEIHNRIAELLIERPNPTAADEDAIAANLIEAGDHAHPAEIAHWTRRAGLRALGAGEWTRAGQLLGRAANLAEGLGAHSQAQASELHRFAAWAHMAAHDDGPNLHHIEAALRIDRAIGTPKTLAESLLLAARGEDRFARTRLGETSAITLELEHVVESLAPDEYQLRANAYLTLCGIRSTNQAEEAAERFAQLALENGQRSGDHGLLSLLYGNLALAWLGKLQLEEALRNYDRAIESAKQVRSPLTLIRLHQRAGVLRMLGGDFDAGDTHDEEADKITRSTGELGDPIYSLCTRAARYVIQDRRQDAADAIEDAMRIVRRSRYSWTRGLLLSIVAAAHCQAGRWGDAHVSISRVAEEESDPISIDFSRRYGALVNAVSGDRPAIGTDAFAPLDALERDGPINWFQLPDLAVRVELADMAGLPLVTPGIARALERATDAGFAFSIGWPVLIPRVAAVAAHHTRSWVSSERLFETALEVTERTGASYEAARTHLDFARMLATRGESGDRERAKRLLEDKSSETLRAIPSLLSERSQALLELLRGS